MSQRSIDAIRARVRARIEVARPKPLPKAKAKKAAVVEAPVVETAPET